MTKEHKSGYAILRAKLAKQAEYAEQQAAEIRLLQATGESYKESIATYHERCKRLYADIETRDERISRLRDIVEQHKEREAWLYKHTPWVIRLWYLKHFGL